MPAFLREVSHIRLLHARWDTPQLRHHALQPRHVGTQEQDLLIDVADLTICARWAMVKARWAAAFMYRLWRRRGRDGVEV